MNKTLIFIALTLSCFVMPGVYASSICHQGNLELLSSRHPEIKALIKKHEKEQENFEKKLEVSSGRTESELNESMQPEKKLHELDKIVTKDFKEMAQRQYAEFFELCTELTE